MNYPIQMWRVNEIEKVPVAKDPRTGKPYVFIREIQRFAPIQEGKKYDYRPIGDGKYVVIQDGREIPCIDQLEPWSWKDYEKWAEKKNITPEKG